MTSFAVLAFSFSIFSFLFSIVFYFLVLVFIIFFVLVFVNEFVIFSFFNIFVFVNENHTASMISKYNSYEIKFISGVFIVLFTVSTLHKGQGKENSRFSERLCRV